MTGRSRGPGAPSGPERPAGTGGVGPDGTRDEQPHVASIRDDRGPVPGRGAHEVGGSEVGEELREVGEELAESMDAGGMGRGSAFAKALVEQGALADSIGGWRGMIDSTAPSAVFLVAFTVTGRALTPAIWAAVVTGVLVAGWRLLRRQSVQQVFAGFVGVAFCAWLAARTGRAEDFYLPGLLWNVLYAAVLAGSAVVGHPLVGYLVGALTGDLTGWRSTTVLRRAYALATWVLVAMFVLRVVVQAPLYLAGWVEALGAARLAMGVPLYVGTVLLCYTIVQRARRAAAALPAAAPASPSGPQ